MKLDLLQYIWVLFKVQAVIEDWFVDTNGILGIFWHHIHLPFISYVCPIVQEEEAILSYPFQLQMTCKDRACWRLAFHKLGALLKLCENRLDQF